jgi:hypothetical protein
MPCIDFMAITATRKWGPYVALMLVTATSGDLALGDTGIVKLLGMILSPGNSRHFPDAIATDPTLRRPALYQ